MPSLREREKLLLDHASGVIPECKNQFNDVDIEGMKLPPDNHTFNKLLDKRHIPIKDLAKTVS